MGNIYIFALVAVIPEGGFKPPSGIVFSANLSEMKRNYFLLVLALALGNNVFGQRDTAENHKVKLSQFYGGLGGGLGHKGDIIGMSSTFILTNDWGASISYKNNFFKPKNIPDNYYEGAFLPPVDFLQIISLKLLKEFPTKNKRLRFGIEGGPSWVNYQTTNFLGLENNIFAFKGAIYETSHTVKNSIGLSLRAKAEFPFFKYLGIEGAAFANINKLNSFLGMELYLTFGLVRNRKRL
ncbi:MAG: hypothetical protein ABI855_03915 [Bacteroidota bacterium]